MGLAEAVWRTNAKFGTAIFLTTCSYGFFYTVVNHSSPVDDARAWWTGELRGFWGSWAAPVGLSTFAGSCLVRMRPVSGTPRARTGIDTIVTQAVALFASSIHVHRAAGACILACEVCTI
jgi:hypothetical protein